MSDPTPDQLTFSLAEPPASPSQSPGQQDMQPPESVTKPQQLLDAADDVIESLEFALKQIRLGSS